MATPSILNNLLSCDVFQYDRSQTLLKIQSNPHKNTFIGHVGRSTRRIKVLLSLQEMPNVLSGCSITS